MSQNVEKVNQDKSQDNSKKERQPRREGDRRPRTEGKPRQEGDRKPREDRQRKNSQGVVQEGGEHRENRRNNNGRKYSKNQNRKPRRELPEFKIENPFENFTEIKREDINANTVVPHLPERPNLMTKEKKELLIEELTTKILELKDKKLNLSNKIAEIHSKLKKQKPSDVLEAEGRRKKLIEEQNGHLKVLKELNLEKTQIKNKITSFDDQKPDKLKKTSQQSGNLPQDEEELNKMLKYWENVLETKSLKSAEEESILKKLDQLELMRKSIGDYTNISKETATLKKQLQAVKTKVAEKKTHMDRLRAEITKEAEIVNDYYEKHNSETEGERSEQDKIKEAMKSVDEKIDELYTEKSNILGKFKAESVVMESYLNIKRNVEYVKRVKAALEREEESKKDQEEREKKRKENQMSPYEVNKTYAVQLKRKLEELQKTSGKKVVLGLETIQIFDKINLNTFPAKKTDLPACIETVDKYIAEQEHLHSEHTNAN